VHWHKCVTGTSPDVERGQLGFLSQPDPMANGSGLRPIYLSMDATPVVAPLEVPLISSLGMAQSVVALEFAFSLVVATGGAAVVEHTFHVTFLDAPDPTSFSVAYGCVS